MRSLSFIIIVLTINVLTIYGQSPHGDLKGLDCANCHQSTDWKVNLAHINFDHSETGFSLTGQHSTINCSSCHADLIFSKAQSSCNFCHKDVHQNSVGLDCSSCHKPDTWLIENRNELHQKSRFPLIGSHLKADCIECHAGYPNLNFVTLGVNCIDCHQNEYRNTQNPNHSLVGFSTNCLDCHSMLQSKWSAEIFAHNFFPLVGGHNIQNCFSCHEQGGNFKGLSTTCYSCHRNDYETSSNPPHQSNNFPTQCQQCHVIQNWRPASFDHNTTQFPLTGAHISVNCSNCHQTGYTQMSTQCVSCHLNNFNSTTNPNHTTLSISTECTSCHTTNANWKPAQFPQHNNYFALTGAHALISTNCEQCHNSNYTNLSNACVACHQGDYNSAINPNHTNAGISTSCEGCHNSTAWIPSTFNHAVTGFELIGQHASIQCSSCHQGTTAGLNDQCVSCHQNNYNTAQNHVAQGYPLDCKMCHNSIAWNQSTFNHNNTSFQLTGAHISVTCSSCHSNGFSNTPTECSSCHQNDYYGTTNPNHVTLNLSNQCQTCHTTNPNWKPATFPIHSNYFQFVGAHIAIQNNCTSCHINGYNNTPNVCYGCHQNDYQTTTNPPHQISQFPTDCVPCHSQSTWVPSTFNHDGPYFPIYSGKHKGKWTTCSQCHSNPSNYTIFSCIDCHEHNQTSMNNKHQGVSGYIYASSACYSCHPQGTVAGAFNHSTSIFPLTGAHQTVECNQCHQNGYANTPTVCYDCHQLNYTSTTNPNHTTLSISTECTSCHTTNANWKPAQFPQHNNYFALTGAHALISTNCEQCHNSNYTNLSNACVACHQGDYNSAINPNHTNAGISTSCEGCHNSTAWIPSTFNHAVTGFELIGQHASIQCSSCHQGTTAGLNDQCVSCHQNNYNTAQNHVAQGYPLDCKMCHNSIAWNQSTFNHNNTSFQLTGAHISVTCSSCHSNGFSNTPTECSSCHQNDYYGTTNPNHVTLNLSNQCQTCHTTNPNWKPATFPIHSNYFQFVGAHIAIQNNCTSCHINGYNNTPNVCYGCHQNDYQTTTNPPHQISQFPTDCVPCHSQSTWVPSTFNHDGPYFPIYSGKHKGKWTTCSQCHSNPSNYTIFSCIDCHEHNQTSMNNKHQGVSGYIYASSACYDCHPRGNGLKMLEKSFQKVN